MRDIEEIVGDERVPSGDSEEGPPTDTLLQRDTSLPSGRERILDRILDQNRVGD